MSERASERMSKKEKREKKKDCIDIYVCVCV